MSALRSTELVLVDAPSPRIVGDELLLEFGADLMVENLSPRTIQAYLHDLFALARYVRKPMDAVTTEDLSSYLRDTMAHRLSVSTRARRVAAIRRFFDWLRRIRHLPGSVAQDMRPVKRTRSLHRFWTEEQVVAFRRAFRGEPAAILNGHTRSGAIKLHRLVPGHVVLARDRAVCELGLMGLRVSEVLGLCLYDVIELDDPNRASILVHRKGRKDQYLPLVPNARTALRSWLAVRPTVPSQNVVIRLPFQPGRPRMRYESFGLIMKAYAARAGLPLPPHKAFHHLRHTAGQQMSELGFGIEVAQMFLGHESPATTRIYYEVSSKRLRDVSRRFGYGKRPTRRRGKCRESRTLRPR